MSKAGGYIRLIRPLNCVMMGSAVIIGAALASLEGLNAHWLNLVYGFATGFTLTAASMVINDFYDRKIDAVNEPNRPIPRGLIKPKEALAFAFVLTAIGLSSASLTNLLCLLAAILAWIVFTAYTTFGKRSGLPGNFLVSTCVAIPFVYGSIAIVGVIQSNVMIFASIAFLSNTGREATKGIVDVQGDKVQGVKTLAVRYGEKTAAILAVIFYLSAVALSPIPWYLKLVSSWFIPFVATTNLGLVASSIILLRDPTKESARKVKNAVLLWFIVGLLAFLAGAIG